MSTFTFKWPKGPQDVIITGTFDNWSKTLYLVKQPDGSFELTVPLPSGSDKILYKYVVDGEWLVSRDQKITNDENGIENNYVDASDLVSIKDAGVAIPEAAGLSTTVKGSSDVKATVMPQVEQQQVSLGEAGIQIPQDKESLQAFETVRDVDAKALNEEIAKEEEAKTLSAAEKKKQKKKVKRSQYKKKKKAAAAAASGAAGAAGVVAGTTTGTEESTEESPEPEAVAAATTAINASEEPKAEEPKAEEPKAEEPKVEEPKVEDPVVEKVEEPKVEEPKVEEPNIEDPVVEKADEPAVEEPVVEKPVVDELVVKEVVVEKPAAKEPVVEQSKADDPAYHSLDPLADGKEVEAEPVPAVNREEEEIIVAQGKGDVEAQILAAEKGNVTLEEIKPTESERVKLTEGLSSKSEKSDKSDKSTVKPKDVKKEVKTEGTKEEPKKKKGFFSKLKKIFS